PPPTRDTRMAVEAARLRAVGRKSMAHPAGTAACGSPSYGRGDRILPILAIALMALKNRWAGRTALLPPPGRRRPAARAPSASRLRVWRPPEEDVEELFSTLQALVPASYP